MIWQTISADSPYRTAVAVRQELQAGHIAEAANGLAELIDALSNIATLTWEDVFDTVYELDGQ
jgi:hypothetical protein